MPIIGGTGSGGGGGGTLLFDSTVTGADAATIDTGANGIAAGSHLIIVTLYARTDEATVLSNIQWTVNNDATAVYDSQRLTAQDTAVSSAGGIGANSWLHQTAGASAAANVFGQTTLIFAGYDQTAGFKTGQSITGVADTTAANDAGNWRLLSYRSTSAISRMKVTPNTGGAKLKVGSRLTIIGL